MEQGRWGGFAYSYSPLLPHLRLVLLLLSLRLLLLLTFGPRRTEGLEYLRAEPGAMPGAHSSKDLGCQDLYLEVHIPDEVTM